MTFYSVGNVIIPTDGVIFFKGVGQPPTSIYIYTQDCDLPISWAKGGNAPCSFLRRPGLLVYRWMTVMTTGPHSKLYSPRLVLERHSSLLRRKCLIWVCFFLKSFNWTSLDRLGPIHSFGLHPGRLSAERFDEAESHLGAGLCPVGMWIELTLVFKKKPRG